MSAGDVNKAILVGRVARDPEIRMTKVGVPQAAFDITTTEIWFDKPTNERREKTASHRIVVYGPMVKVVEKCVRKGARLYLEGQIETRRWVGKDGSPGENWTTEIVVQGWSGRVTVLDFADGPARVKADADDDGPDNNSPSDKHLDKIDSNLPWLA